jgi:hypothetical protein
MSQAKLGKMNINGSQMNTSHARSMHSLPKTSIVESIDIELIHPEKYRLIAKQKILSNWKISMIVANLINIYASIQALMPLREIDHTAMYKQ